MDDFITGLLVGVFGEKFFREIAKKRYFVPFFFCVLVLIVQLVFSIFLLFLSLPSLFGGYYENKTISEFFYDYINAIAIESQPYALLFSMFIALLGALSYLWHRKYSRNQSV